MAAAHAAERSWRQALAANPNPSPRPNPNPDPNPNHLAAGPRGEQGAAREEQAGGAADLPRPTSALGGGGTAHPRHPGGVSPNPNPNPNPDPNPNPNPNPDPNPNPNTNPNPNQVAHPLALSAESLRSLVSVPVIAKLRSLASVPALAPDEPQGRRAAHTIDVAPASHTPGHETDQHDAQSGGGGGGSGGAGGMSGGGGAAFDFMGGKGGNDSFDFVGDVMKDNKRSL